MKPFIEFNTDDIQYIQFTPTRPADMYFFNAVPKIKKRLFGFLWYITVHPGLSEGWGPDWEPRYNDYYGGWEKPSRHNEEYYNNSQEYYFYNHPKAGKELRKCAKVYVCRRKTYHTAYFPSNEEAEVFIDEIKRKSNNNWQLIKQ